MLEPQRNRISILPSPHYLVPVRFLQPFHSNKRTPSVCSEEISDVKLIQNRIKEDIQCRICLQNEKQGLMLSPCKCLGSVKYTHKKCLAEWIKRKLQNGQQLIRCQFCQQLYDYDITATKQLDCSQLFKNYGKKKYSMLVFIFFYFVFLLGLFAFIALLAVINHGTKIECFKLLQINSSTQMIIYVVGIMAGFIILTVVTVVFLQEYAQKRILRITDIRPFFVYDRPIRIRISDIQ